MKILKGSYKGVPLAAPQDGSVRPTVDHVKKHIFRGDENYRGKAVWDLFAGSGGVGLEYLSRGASELVLVEQQKSAISCIQLNLAECRLKAPATLAQQQVTVVKANVDQFLRDPESYGVHRAPDIVFLDPPYGQGLVARTAEQLLACELITPDTRILLEHVTDDPLGELGERGRLEREETYGPKRLTWFRKVGP